MMPFKSTTSMKCANCLALSVLLLLVAGCANPELVQESLVPEHTVQVSSLVVEVDDSAFARTAFGHLGNAYVDAMGRVVKDSESDIPVLLVTTNAMQLHEKGVEAIIEARPTHLIRLHVVSTLSRAEQPVAVIWQLDLMSVTVTALDVSNRPGTYRVSYKPVYRVQLSGHLCIDDTTLTVQHQVAQCGQQMGDAFVRRLKERHVMTPL
jgi:hypothetical protein